VQAPLELRIDFFLAHSQAIYLLLAPKNSKRHQKLTAYKRQQQKQQHPQQQQIYPKPMVLRIRDGALLNYLTLRTHIQEENKWRWFSYNSNHQQQQSEINL
jgi:hypothetical protein